MAEKKSKPVSMSVKLGDWQVEYDVNYGADRRSGWSVSYKGAYKVQLEEDQNLALRRARMPGGKRLIVRNALRVLAGKP